MKKIENPQTLSESLGKLFVEKKTFRQFDWSFILRARRPSQFGGSQISFNWLKTIYYLKIVKKLKKKQNLLLKFLIEGAQFNQ